MLFKISQSLQFLRNIVIAVGLSTLTSTLTIAQPVVTPPPFVAQHSGGGGGSPTQFVLPTFGGVTDPIHFMSPTGSDSNDGLAATTGGGHGPWASPNHALNCGDVIVAVSGAYNGAMNTFGNVSNCPSTTGGIDGAGGILAAVLLCGGSDLGTTNGCVINCATAACAAGHGTSNTANPAVMQLNNNFWSVQGWTTNGNGATHRGFQADGCLTATTLVHHISVINSIVANAGQGIATDTCGWSCCSAATLPGIDYFSIVGNLTQNAAQDSICLGSIDYVGVGASDTLPGTHLYVYGNFINSTNAPACVSLYDSEAIILDTFDARNYSQQTVVANNVTWNNMRYGFQAFYQSYNFIDPIIKVYNNTFYNDLDNVGNSSGGEININTSVGTNATGPHNPSWILSISNNILQNTKASPGYALIAGGTTPVSPGSMTIGGTGLQNIVSGTATSTAGGTCDRSSSPISECAFNGNSFGTNIVTNPLFANGSDLTTNWVGVPNCAGFQTVTACMGYNVITSTLTANTPIADIQASCTQCSGKGYQLPSSTCNTNPDFPSNLKGLVRLGWDPVQQKVFQYHDLVTTACGM